MIGSSTAGSATIVNSSILQFFAEPHNREVIAQLRAAGVHWPEGKAERVPPGALAGKTFVLTGTLATMSRTGWRKPVSSAPTIPRAARLFTGV